jgi:hypothetical protein
MSRFPNKVLPLALIAAMAAPAPLAAQEIGYGDYTGGEAGVSAGDDGGEGGYEGRSRRGSRGGKATRVEFAPYIEFAQVAAAELSPGNDVLTYSQIAAGIDAALIGQHNAVSASLRYERRIAWDNDTSDGDTISGVVNGYATVTPGVQIHAGALAARTRIEDGGSAVLGPLGDDDAVTQVYSVYAGPSVATALGDVAVNANYRIGYSRVESPDAVAVAPGSPGVDVFDESTVHAANVSAGLAPNTALPVGVGVAGQLYREDISNLDQRVDDRRAMATVTVPLGPSLAVSGSVGYEDVEISARDAVRDAAGNPVIGPDGRFVTDKSAPRILAFDESGLIWDAGVTWRPSRRTSLEAHVGRRYGSTSVWGTFSYAPNTRSLLSIGAYDNVAGFGGQINSFLADLPEDFVAIRDPISGDLTGCVSSLESGNCLSGALGSVRSSTFRARGIAANYSHRFGRYTAGVGAGYDRRKFIAAPGTVLAAANGVVDENYWLAAYLNGRIDRHSSFQTNIYANWLETGDGLTGDVSALGATAAYYRSLAPRLSATAAVGIDSVSREDPLEDQTAASALLGVRYTFGSSRGN